VEALRPYPPLAVQGTSDLAPAYLAELARLWPELHSTRPNLLQAPHLEASQAQARLFHALTCLLLKLAAWRPPLVLCVEALDELLARQVITGCDETYVFKHSLIHQVVYHDLSYGRRRLLHRRAGEALAKTHSDERAGNLYFLPGAPVA
jgi:hypothetical protein